LELVVVPKTYIDLIKPRKGPAMNRKTTIFDSVLMLALIGILAGAIGGLGIGLVVKASSHETGTSGSTQH
jgi:hypothetical protein